MECCWFLMSLRERPSRTYKVRGRKNEEEEEEEGEIKGRGRGRWRGRRKKFLMLTFPFLIFESTYSYISFSFLFLHSGWIQNVYDNLAQTVNCTQTNPNQHKVQLVLVGNKIDLPNRVITTYEGF
jgi:hypothetical protein